MIIFSCVNKDNHGGARFSNATDTFGMAVSSPVENENHGNHGNLNLYFFVHENNENHRKLAPKTLQTCKILGKGGKALDSLA